MAIGPFLDRLQQFDAVMGYQLNRIVDFITSFTDYSGAFNLPTSTGGTLPATSFGTLPIKFSSTTFTGGSSSITLNVPPLFKHIRFFGQARSSVAAANDEVYIQFNNDTGSNYFWQQYFGSNNAVTSNQNAASTTQPNIAHIPASTALANSAGCFTIDIPNYAGTVFHKEATGVGQDWEAHAVASEFVYQRGARWENTAAITKVTLGLISGNFVSGSTLDGYVWP